MSDVAKRTVIVVGNSPSEVLKKARQMYGDDITFKQTIENKKKKQFELEIEIEESEYKNIELKRKLEAASSLNAKTSQTKVTPNTDVLLNISEAARQISKIANVEEAPFEFNRYNENKTQTQTFVKQRNEAEQLEIKQLKEQIAKLTDNMKLIQNMFWEEKAIFREGLNIPPEFAEIYKISKNSGMSSQYLDNIMKMTLEYMPLKMRQNSETVKKYFRVLLTRMIPIRHEKELSGNNKKIMMLVGPTGVGKTTTLAKLAARYAYMMNKRYKVGIITLDTYRMGAVEQLMSYAKIMKLGIEVVSDPPEFVSTLNSLRHCDYILIDTVGRSQNDKSKIDILKDYINADTSLTIDVNLVVSLNTKYEDLKDIYNNFEDLNIDTLMLTKLDETCCFGNILNLIFDTKKPLSYFSIGQDVPNDIMVADKEFLVNCLLNGFSRNKK
ncbi:MAG: flagellar biosynthesis protein FlhF [Campylobacterales bacterium]|nr:flagellar biosynthesis protein FlhF [Campylobacterales bacterium]